MAVSMGRTVIVSCKSATYMMKISGPLMEPCGVPRPKLTQILKYGHQFEQIALFHKGTL